MDRLVKRVVARWNFRVAMSGYRPAIPSWVFERYATKAAFQSNPKIDAALLDAGRDSIGALLPSFLAFLRRSLGDRYSMNSSVSANNIFYFFEPPQPIDSVAVHLGARGGKLFLEVSYLPHELKGGVNLSKIVEEKVVVEDPDLVGLFMMRLIRKVLARV